MGFSLGESILFQRVHNTSEGAFGYAALLGELIGFHATKNPEDSKHREPGEGQFMLNQKPFLGQIMKQYRNSEYVRDDWHGVKVDPEFDNVGSRDPFLDGLRCIPSPF